MNKHFTHFGELYLHLQNQPPKDDFLHRRINDGYKSISKEEFLMTVRYLSLAFHKKGWKDKQIGIAVSHSPYWLMLDYALMLSGAVSVPLFTNISSKNLHYQILDAAIQTVFIENKVQENIIHSAGGDVETVYLEECSGYHSFGEFVEEGKNVGVLLNEVNPTVMTVVPRLLEKVFFKMKLKAMEGNFIKQTLVRLAFYRATTKDPMTKFSLLDKVLDTLVYKKLRLALGTRMGMLISGGAALLMHP